MLRDQQYEQLRARFRRVSQAIREEREWQQINGNPDADHEDALDSLFNACGDTGYGCTLAGTEYCDFECPFS
jgi:hypothetical protein